MLHKSVYLAALVALVCGVQLTTARVSTLDSIVGSLKTWTDGLTAPGGDAVHAAPVNEGEPETGDASEDARRHRRRRHDDCNAESLESTPGKAWDREFGWRYATSQNSNPRKLKKENYALRSAAYLKLVKGTSPWPAWFEPTVSLLPADTLFQMAMSSTQGDDRPGSFGTFDEIDKMSEVRDDLAVLQAWKPDVQRVNVYRVIVQLPVYVGPVGPQVDPEECVLLPGRFSQFQMLVPRNDRMEYIELVSSHPIVDDMT